LAVAVFDGEGVELGFLLSEIAVVVGESGGDGGVFIRGQDADFGALSKAVVADESLVVQAAKLFPLGVVVGRLVFVSAGCEQDAQEAGKGVVRGFH